MTCGFKLVQPKGFREPSGSCIHTGLPFRAYYQDLRLLFSCVLVLSWKLFWQQNGVGKAFDLLKSLRDIYVRDG